MFIGSTIGGFIPELWHAAAFSYTSVLFSGIGAFVGLWIGLKLRKRFSKNITIRRLPLIPWANCSSWI
jgi:hypothetical protein